MNRQSGLTLIEVLIAAVILFAALSLASVTISSLRSNSASAERLITTLQPARMIALSVRQQIRDNPETARSGSGQLNGVEFSWQAEVIKRGSAPEQFDFNSGSVIAPPERFLLLLVKLQLEYQGRAEQLEFKELAWLPMGV
ncbi:type IV pilus modification PilV family protein [Rheinheimera aquimaris]|uniref:type IV pilus modification PilV family protein n=1 Tax=Rheinheimera aquimaris TaxID=412437 RepID=UPI003A96BE38